jgi:hypothetical protein
MRHALHGARYAGSRDGGDVDWRRPAPSRAVSAACRINPAARRALGDADLVGKGGHVRTVPIPAWVKSKVDAWMAAAAITHGPVFRAINKAGRVWGDGMSPKVPWDVVRAAAARAGIDKLAPHDCGAPALASATSRVANWIRSSFYSATSPSRRRSAISDASRSSGLR